MKVTRIVGELAIRYKNTEGDVHRENDLPAVEYHAGNMTGSKVWMLNGQFHRLDNPAVIRIENGIDRGNHSWSLDGTTYSSDRGVPEPSSAYYQALYLYKGIITNA